MAGARIRRKGKRAEAAAARLLGDRDWSVVRTRSGVAEADLLATDPNGKTWAVEVKDAAVWRWRPWLHQARTQARKHRAPWMLLAKITGTRSWLVIREGERPVVWTEKPNVRRKGGRHE